MNIIDRRHTWLHTHFLTDCERLPPHRMREIESQITPVLRNLGIVYDIHFDAHRHLRSTRRWRRNWGAPSKLFDRGTGGGERGVKSHPLAAYPAAWTICPMRFLLAFAQGGVLSPLLPLLRETFQVSPGELGLLISMFGLSRVTMDLIAAYLLRHIPLFGLLLLGIIMAGAGSLLCAFAPGFYWLVGARVLIGLGVSITTLAGLTVIIESTPLTAQGRANNLLEFSAIGGSAVSPTLSGLMAALIHWRAAFVLGALFVAGAFAWVMFTRQALEEDTCSLTRKSSS